jgi:starvation-inducible DNA-binding protein
MANTHVFERTGSTGTGDPGGPLGIPPETASEARGLLEATVGDLYTAYLQVKGHHWTVEGAEYRDLHLFLDEVATDLLKGVDEAAERLADLGGAPPETAPAIQQASRVQPTLEPARGRGTRARLAADRALLQAVIDNLRARIGRAMELREHGTRHLLDRLLARVEGHAGDMDAFLTPDSLAARE